MMHFHQIVKVNEIEKRLETTAVDAVRALLERVPNIQIIGVRHGQQLASGQATPHSALNGDTPADARRAL